MAKKPARPHIWTGEASEEHKFREENSGIQTETNAENRTENPTAERAEDRPFDEPVNLEQILEQIEPSEPEPPREKRKRPARKTAAAGAAGKKGTPENDLKLADAIFAIHAGIAYLTKIDELALSVENAEKLGAAIETVDKNLKKKINPKFIAWINLISISVGIYVPMGFAIKEKIKENKGKKAMNNANTNLDKNPKINEIFPIVDLNG